MKVDLRSRRMFLQGAGGLLLAMPALPSLLWKASRVKADDTPPIRYVQWITNHGQFDYNFWPAGAQLPMEPAAVGGAEVAGVTVRPLSSIKGPLSFVLNEAFDPIRAKINLVRGLDLMVVSGYHNACVPTCASWPRTDDHAPLFSHSIDSILESSAKVYPEPVRVPVLRMTPGVNSAYKWGSFCWTTRDGAAVKLPAYDAPQTALDAVFAGNAKDPELKAQNARIRLVDQVKEDFRHVGNLNALSGADKQLLQHYVDLLADIQRRASAEVSVFTPPTLQKQADFDVLHQNAIDVAIAAMMCGATRVVAYHCYQGAPAQYDEETFHNWCHTNGPKHGDLMVYRYRQLARLISKMDQVKDTNGKTLLDNSLVYSGNELSDPGHGQRHLQNMPVILAGNAGGRLTTGNYIDFGGRLYNNLLVTIFNVMGLTHDDYQREGVDGFGEYTGNNPEKYQKYLTVTERRKPLPFLYKGASG
jgi:hypothetical protein